MVEGGSGDARWLEGGSGEARWLEGGRLEGGKGEAKWVCLGVSDTVSSKAMV